MVVVETLVTPEQNALKMTEAEMLQDPMVAPDVQEAEMATEVVHPLLLLEDDC